ncbi:hypothetical protein QFZ54_000321 [Sphingomonas faeni]|nr:hypothetical protein [Sphingomonas faeni]
MIVPLIDLACQSLTSAARYGRIGWVLSQHRNLNGSPAIALWSESNGPASFACWLTQPPCEPLTSAAQTKASSADLRNSESSNTIGGALRRSSSTPSVVIPISRASNLIRASHLDARSDPTESRSYFSISPLSGPFVAVAMAPSSWTHFNPSETRCRAAPVPCGRPDDRSIPARLSLVRSQLERHSRIRPILRGNDRQILRFFDTGDTALRSVSDRLD